jgi:hypothetical protein
VGEPERNTPIGRPSGIWEDNVKIYFQEIGLAGVTWINLALDRF